VSSVPRATVRTLTPKKPKKPKNLNLFLKALGFYQPCIDYRDYTSEVVSFDGKQHPAQLDKILAHALILQAQCTQVNRRGRNRTRDHVLTQDVSYLISTQMLSKEIHFASGKATVIPRLNTTRINYTKIL